MVTLPQTISLIRKERQTSLLLTKSNLVLRENENEPNDIKRSTFPLMYRAYGLKATRRRKEMEVSAFSELQPPEVNG